ncbi:MAG: thiamine phosphate synthase [Proteobacteria bacterium]|nr:thiamine phosphate synthase [Pseudomonadota bacterium]
MIINLTDQRRGLNLSQATGTAQAPLPSFILMTDETRLADPVAAAKALPPNSAVILRHYSGSNREHLARRLMAVTRRQNIRVLIAADVRLALKVGADGVHLPEAMAALGPGPWQAWRKPGWLVTAAAHSPAALFKAKVAGADAALLSPVFATASHPDRAALGVVRFQSWCRLSPLPVYALGGMSVSAFLRLRGGDALGFAGISGFVNRG